MLDIWCELQQRQSIRVLDEEKCGLYTLDDMVSSLDLKFFREPTAV